MLNEVSTLSIKQNFKFGKEYRLLKKYDYDRVFGNNNFRSRNENFTVLAAFNNLDHPRVGIIVAKKQVKFAHKRNLIKRLCREYFRLHKNIIPNCDFVILARSYASEQDNKLIFKSLDTIFKKSCRFYQK